MVARLYDEYAERLTRYCRKQLKSAHEAEDAVQTTFVHAVQALQNGVVPECESAWLYTIAKNVCHSLHRANGLRALHAVDVELDTLSAPETASSDLVEGLSSALATLPERQRNAIVLREWRGLSSHEVASRLGMRTSETYALLTRARRSMASALAATTGRTTIGINLGSLLAKLRTLLFGGAAKTAATTSVAVALAVGGTVALERETSARSPDRASPSVGANAADGMSTSTANARHADDPQVPVSRKAPASSTRRRGPVATPPPGTSSAPVSHGAAAGAGAAAPVAPGSTSEPRPAEPSSTRDPKPEPKVTVSTGTPEVRVGDRRVRVRGVVPPAVEDVVAPVERLDPPVDVPVDSIPPEVTEVVDDVVDAVDDALEPLSGVVPPPSSSPSPPPALPTLLP